MKTTMKARKNGKRKRSSQGAMKQFKVIVEKYSDGYVAYPLGLKGVVVGEGDTYEEVLADIKSAIRFHIETFEDDLYASGYSS
jgi:predicted RNase H-like HicB family nuclease